MENADDIMLSDRSKLKAACIRAPGGGAWPRVEFSLLPKDSADPGISVTEGSEPLSSDSLTVGGWEAENQWYREDYPNTG